jgi:hypothetical protein
MKWTNLFRRNTNHLSQKIMAQISGEKKAVLIEKYGEIFHRLFYLYPRQKGPSGYGTD